MNEFTPESRQDTLRILEEAFRSDSRIVGLVLVGSGAHGFADQYSDLDLVVAVSEDEDSLAVFGEWDDRIRGALPVLSRFSSIRAARVGLYGFVLRDCLEVDISFQPVSLLTARSPNWQVIFDTTGTLEDRLAASWDEQDTRDVASEYLRVLESIWHYVMHAATAVERDHLWRALHYVVQVRERAVELEGLRSGHNTYLFREAHLIPQDRLAPLASALPASLTAPELLRALKVATECFFDAAGLLDKELGKEHSAELREAMMAHLAENRWPVLRIEEA